MSWKFDKEKVKKARDKVSSVEELVAFIEKYAEGIFVREECGEKRDDRKYVPGSGKWSTFSLAELPGKVVLKHTVRLIKYRTCPVVALESK